MSLAYPVAKREHLLECHEPHFSMFPKRLAMPGNLDWADCDRRNRCSGNADRIGTSRPRGERELRCQCDPVPE